jgi:ABC-type transport system involved in cytochrome c biogenesis permease subunit
MSRWRPGFSRSRRAGTCLPAKAGTPTSAFPAALLAAIVSLAFASPLWAATSGGIDWTPWQRMPVLHDGRIMPLDSFARAKVQNICGEVSPTLGMIGSLTNAELKSLSPDEIKRRASEGRPRRFLAAELLYSWTVEPEKWDDIPFLAAEDETLRADVLEVPILGEDNSRLKFVSPRQVRLSKKFAQIVGEVEELMRKAQRTQKKPEFSPIQEKARTVMEELSYFLMVTYDPGRADKINHGSGLLDDFERLQNSYGQFAGALSDHIELAEPRDNLRRGKGGEQASALQEDLSQRSIQIARELREFEAAWGPVLAGAKPVKSLEPVAGRLRRLAVDLDAKMREVADLELPDPDGLVVDDRETIRANREQLVHRTRNLASQAAQIQWGMYSAAGESINIAPAMEASAFEADRYRSEIHPWISLHALLQGSPELLHAYPTEDVQEIRADWDEARNLYLQFHQGETGSAPEFSAAIERFTRGVRAMAEAIEADRRALPIRERDQSVMAKTAYPSALTTDAELLYNWLDPFFWSGCASLAAACFLGLSFIALRKPLFWTGISMSILGIAFIVSGFAVRVYITRWAPVTGMFDTIVWVTMASSLFTLWVTFLPLLGPTSKTVWRWSAIPGSWEARSNNDRDDNGRDDSYQDDRGRGNRRRKQNRRQDPVIAELRERPHLAVRALALAMRLGLFLAGLFVALDYMGVIAPDSAGKGFQFLGVTFPAFQFHPDAILPGRDLGSSMPNLNTSLVWAASMFVSAMFVWHLPRIVPSALFAIPMSLGLASRPEGAERMEKIYRTRVVALFGAVGCFSAAMIALYAQFPKDIQALQPVLRSNFWLGIHVLTITTSYAAVLASWVIGNLAIGFFAFGRYRRVDGAFRPPAFCGTLASMNYRVLQVAVLLITTGTILGGLWADVSWGRFWGWDPKEVGALLALLIIMTALHGRRAGWHGDLSIAIGSVFGFVGVMWAWYVVNFILNAGLHAYGAGEGGKWIWPGSVLLVQILFIGVAVVRVILESRQPPEIVLLNEVPSGTPA